MRMKRFCAVVVLFLIFILASCGNHEHSYSEEWSYNDYEHWHQATCHRWRDRKDVEPHTWGDPIVVKEVTDEADGEINYYCTVCNAKKVEIIPMLEDHTYSEEWSYDDTHHWHQAICNHKDSYTDKAEHDWQLNETDQTIVCSVCGKVYEQDPKRPKSIVSFLDFDGTVIDVKEVEVYEAVTAPTTTPERLNYRFDGWYMDGVKLDDNFSIKVTEDKNIEARYVRQYTVSFVDYDGQKITDDIKVDAGGAFEYPTHPQREGYEFKEGAEGWSHTNTGVDSDLTITALYQIKYFDVKFFNPDGTQIGSTQKVAWNNYAVAPEVDQYYFTWNNEVEGYDKNTAYTNPTWSVQFDSVQSNLDVYAVYQTKVTDVVLICDNPSITTKDISENKKARATIYIFSSTETVYALNLLVDLNVYDESGNKTNYIYFDDKLNDKGQYENINIYNGYTQGEEAIEETKDASATKVLKFVWSSGTGNKINSYNAIYSISFSFAPNTPKGTYSFEILALSYLIVDGMEKCEPVILSGTIVVC